VLSLVSAKHDWTIDLLSLVGAVAIRSLDYSFIHLLYKQRALCTTVVVAGISFQGPRVG
jgi:hypothetical protein